MSIKSRIQGLAAQRHETLAEYKNKAENQIEKYLENI